MRSKSAGCRLSHQPSPSSCSISRPTKSSQRWLNQVHALVLAAHPDEHRRRIRRGAETLLAFAQRGFGAHAAGDVADESAEHEVVAESDRRDRQFHREFGAVAMQRRHLDALVQHPRDAGLDVAMQAAAMLIAQALGDDEVGELAAQRFGTRPAEELLGVRIPAGDDSLVVDRHHAVECGFDDELVALLGKSQRTFGRTSQGVRAFAARSIDPDEGDEDHGAREREKRHRGFESQCVVAVRNTASANPPAAAR